MDATWPDSAVYSCRCGTLYTVTYWRWVDDVARPELTEQVRRDGPLEGTCPSCGAAARAAATWLSVDPAGQRATLMLSPDRRAHLLAELRDHLSALERRPHAASHWLLHPEVEFWTVMDEETARRARRVEPMSLTAASGELILEADATRARATVPHPGPTETTARRERGSVKPKAVAASPAPGVPQPHGVPQLIGTDARTPSPAPAPPSLGAYIGDLTFDDGKVRIYVELQDEGFDKWKKAKLSARPIHLRGNGYPLLGLRLVGFFMGQRGVVDALMDVGSPQSADVFRALSKSFRAVVEMTAGEAEQVSREITAPGLEPNAALCLESARGLLARGEYPPQDYDRARDELAQLGVEQRLEPTKVTIAPGSYQHVIGAAEATTALEHLDRVSRKEYLSRLLEVDGLPMGEYDAIRRRVLAGSLEHGLVAPRRFWRRVVASGLVADLEDYANRLAERRAAHEGEEGDLEPERARQAWEALLELCKRKNLRYPKPLRLALDLPDSGPPPPAAPHNIVSGEIGSDPLDDLLKDPTQRLKTATDVLQGRVGGDLSKVFDALDRFDNDELLALLPDLSDLGVRAVPGLLPKLNSERREVRQAAVILLGMSLDPDALEPLSELLIRERTNVWLDVARSLGAYGPVALRRLCQTLNRFTGQPHEANAVERVARALAEIALSDGQVGPGDPSPGHDALSALADSGDPRVNAAARRALATLRDVSESGAVIRGEMPLSEVTAVRGFARRAYEAIMVPEVEVEVEA